jgi:asparagine synthetase B (glutamine-hydrolysing)
MSWRGKYVGWYRLMGSRFGKLLPELSEQEIMESVSPEDVLIAPTIEESKPRNQRKALPHMSLILKDKSIETRVTYLDRESIELLRNIFKDSHRVQRESLFKELYALDPSYETLLYSNTREEKKPRMIRKYISARLDQQLRHSRGSRHSGRSSPTG